uniref:Uncharacterized protein n=1 Tax=Arundo donax TaxID=35708 RepID=A0A0A8YBV7_ARUDO
MPRTRARRRSPRGPCRR